MGARLFVSTTGTDADWVVKLIDVLPEVNEADPKLAGYQLMVASEVIRGRYRKGFERPQPMEPHKVEEIALDLHSRAHRFLKGHRIMVQIQSTWFPLIDRNPQTFVPNIFKAKDSDYRTATHRVCRSEAAPSGITFVTRQDGWAARGSCRRLPRRAEATNYLGIILPSRTQTVSPTLTVASWKKFQRT